MKELFMELLLDLRMKGNITEANLYQSGTYSSFTVETKSGKYKISISKKDEEEKNAD